MSILASSLTLGAADYEWRDDAICRDTDPELFFPVGTTGNALYQIDRAKEVCNECTVAGQCLDFALDTNQDSGIWGGLTEEERRVIRRRRVAAQHAPLPVARARRSNRRVGTVNSMIVPCWRLDPSPIPARSSSTVGHGPDLDRAVEFGRHEGPHDRESEPRRLIELERGVDATTVVDHPHRQTPIEVAQRHVDVATAAALGEPVVDGVLQQLGEHDRQRCGRVGREFVHHRRPR